MRRFLKTRADGLVVTLLGIAFLAYSVNQFNAMSRKVNWIMSPYLFPMIVAGMAILLGIGIIVESRGRRGLLLPDLDGVDTPEQQIAISKRKAGIGDGEKVSLKRFTVTRHF